MCYFWPFQLGPRRCSLGGVDKKKEARVSRKLAEKKRRKDQRKREEERVKREKGQQEGAAEELESLDLGPENSTSKRKNQPNADATYVPPESKSHRRRSPDPVKMPRDICARVKCIGSMARGNVSGEFIVDWFTSALTESGADLSQFNLSANHLNKQKGKKMKELLEEKKANFVPPKAPVLQWDEKKIIRHGEVENRMAVSIAGDERPPQHIGSFLLENGKAETVATEVVSNAAEWGVGKDQVVPSMQVWDTAGTNAGIFQFPSIFQNRTLTCCTLHIPKTKITFTSLSL